MMARVEGIEPPARGFGDRCSTSELHPHDPPVSGGEMAEHTGIEPVISGVTGRRLDR